MKTLAITSGKGGVGKTTLAANLGAALQSLGKRVVVFDADLGLANLDIAIGVRPEATLNDVISGEKTVQQALAEGPGGVRFIAGGSGIEALNHLPDDKLAEVLGQIGALADSTDYLIFDTGAGISDQVMAFLQASDETIVIITPDPSSVTDAYATAKTLWKLREDATIHVIMNMVDSVDHGQNIFERLKLVAFTHTGHELNWLGSVRKDPKAADCVRRRKLFVLEAKGSHADRDLSIIAGKLAEVKLTQTEVAASTSDDEEDEDEEPTFVTRMLGLLKSKLKRAA